MAEMLSMSQSCYANLESGKSSLSVERLLAITEILDIDVSQLFEKQIGNQSLHSQDSLHEAITVSGLSPEIKHAYEQLIIELREEVLFLRGLVMDRKMNQ
jgi:transcriptional regulator with XRE-family HTH domain